MTAGRLLRLLRFAAGLSLDAAAVELAMTPARIRSLERDTADLAYLEGLVLARVYLLCPNCFARHYKAAVTRASVVDLGDADVEAAP
jgi:hypothetical protein